MDNPQLRAADASAAQLLMDWVRSAAEGQGAEQQQQQGAGPPTPQHYCAMYERMDEQAARRAYQQVRTCDVHTGSLLLCGSLCTCTIRDGPPCAKAGMWRPLRSPTSLFLVHCADTYVP